MAISLQVGNPAIDVRISGDRVSCVAARSEIENLIDSCGIWYRHLFLPDHPVVYGLWGGFFIVFWLVAGWSANALFSGDRVGAYVLATAIILLVFFGFKEKMFPKVSFAIGKSATVIENAKIYRGIVGVVIGLGIFAAVVGGVIVEKMKGWLL